MTMLDEWKALQAQIDGFASNAQMIISAHVGDANTSPASGWLEKRADDIQVKLQGFLNSYANELPLACRSVLEDHLRKPVSKLASPYNPGPRAVTVATPFMALSAEVTYLLADTQQIIRRHSERAFSHLRRSIEASPLVRSEWQSAFSKGETASEQLGATHLLLHGIFAFKVNAAGARTDLVFAEPVNPSEVAAVADGLVLTEWKLVKNPSETESVARQARDQADLYTGSALAGVELRSYRYVVLISSQRLRVPDDLQANGVTYRHINISVEPETPSVIARQATHNK
jgi:hypothetical protein